MKQRETEKGNEEEYGGGDGVCLQHVLLGKWVWSKRVSEIVGLLRIEEALVG